MTSQVLLKDSNAKVALRVRADGIVETLAGVEVEIVEGVGDFLVATGEDARRLNSDVAELRELGQQRALGPSLSASVRVTGSRNAALVTADLNNRYSVILMSQRINAPYRDRIYPDGLTIEYEGHDLPRRLHDHNPKYEDQPGQFHSGLLTQNGLFAKAVEGYKSGNAPELVKVYEKLFPGVWSLKGFFDLLDYKSVNDGRRNVYRFVLRLSEKHSPAPDQPQQTLEHTRLISSDVKKEVWKRDGGKCVLCGETKNLHFDHDLPFSKGGTSLTANNVRLLCMKHNLAKSANIE
jgi:hypothetical protein